MLKPSVYWPTQPSTLAVTASKCYVEVGFIMLRKGKLSSIPADFSDPISASPLQLVASNRVMTKRHLLYAHTVLDSYP